MSPKGPSPTGMCSTRLQDSPSEHLTAHPMAKPRVHMDRNRAAPASQGLGLSEQLAGPQQLCASRHPPVCPQTQEEAVRETPNAARRGGPGLGQVTPAQVHFSERGGSNPSRQNRLEPHRHPQGGWTGHACTQQTQVMPQVCVSPKIS